MVRNIVFDMGGVLINFDPHYFIAQTTIQPEDQALLWREVFQSPQWNLMDWGYATEEELYRSICQRLPERLRETAHRLIFSWDTIVPPVEGMTQLIGELKSEGYGIYLLSNATARHKEYWPSVPGAALFDGVFASADYHLVKPQPEIYQTFLKTFSLKAEECLFVDDLPINIAGAQLCRMQGIVFRSTRELRQELSYRGIL